jgi:hypothetical protein
MEKYLNQKPSTTDVCALKRTAYFARLSLAQPEIGNAIVESIRTPDIKG